MYNAIRSIGHKENNIVLPRYSLVRYSAINPVGRIVMFGLTWIEAVQAAFRLAFRGELVRYEIVHAETW